MSLIYLHGTTACCGTHFRYSLCSPFWYSSCKIPEAHTMGCRKVNNSCSFEKIMLPFLKTLSSEAIMRVVHRRPAGARHAGLSQTIFVSQWLTVTYKASVYGDITDTFTQR
ncbi:hypothetical protein CDAR_110321 [Caerostris darwini]|uniref:Uncharacterized protein n=1 Tax=Caerostris darwini TaxID=1538125 RepID=A0AAV4UBG5_9ARAC|nr:hypothetical protein CDAR_110321 [Caerostris darwini]